MRLLTTSLICYFLLASLATANILPSRTTRNDLLRATRMHFQGNFEEAAELLTECVAKIDQECGKWSAHSARALLSLGFSQLKAGEMQKAEASFKRSLAITERVSGKESGKCVGALRALGMLYEKQKEWEKAAIEYDRCVNSLYETDVHSLPNLAEILERYAHVVRQMPAKTSWFGVKKDIMKPKAEQLERRARAIRQKIKAQRSNR